MTIRTRLNLWYSLVLCGVAVAVIGAATYHELVIEKHHHRHGEAKSETELNNEDLLDILTWTVVPAVVLGLAGGWWLARRALAPVTALTGAVEKIHEKNLGEKIPRTNNGDELDRLTEVFNAMTSRLDNSFNRIREFTLHASHELKTPLTVMHGELETALRDESLSQTERERLLSQLDEVQRLTKIVDGLSLLTKADAGQVALNLETVQLDELVRDNFADAQILAEPQSVKVELENCDAISIHGDRHRLRQLLLNLADNAVKYNQPQGRVTMNLRRSGEKAEFTINNTGKGIPPELLPRVFDRFFRGDSAHHSIGTPAPGPASSINNDLQRAGPEAGVPSASEIPVDGCGLGLSIAQWIVSAHGGKIQVESAPSKWTTVTVRLPIEKSK
jgi:signal transduction histidine kinase